MKKCSISLVLTLISPMAFAWGPFYGNTGDGVTFESANAYTVVPALDWTNGGSFLPPVDTHMSNMPKNAIGSVSPCSTSAIVFQAKTPVTPATWIYRVRWDGFPAGQKARLKVEKENGAINEYLGVADSAGVVDFTTPAIGVGRKATFYLRALTYQWVGTCPTTRPQMWFYDLTGAI